MFCMGLHVVISFHNASGLPPPIATMRDCVFIKRYEQKRMTTDEVLHFRFELLSP